MSDLLKYSFKRETGLDPFVYFEEYISWLENKVKLVNPWDELKAWVEQFKKHTVFKIVFYKMEELEQLQVENELKDEVNQ
jgi:hypothetical protein